MRLFAAVLLVFGYFSLKFVPKINQRLRAGPFSGQRQHFQRAALGGGRDAIDAEEVLDAIAPRRLHDIARQHGGMVQRAAACGGDFSRARFVRRRRAGRARILAMARSRASFPCRTTRSERSSISSRNSSRISPAQREKRRLVRFNDIPQSLVHAVISVEDKHFFQHSGFDMFRILKAAYVDVKEGRKQQGASTLSMQLARGFWLDPDKNWRRKIEELLITMHLERKLTKQQIFEYYANQVYLGRHGTFSVNGFGEAARVYFAKDLSQLTLPESALLAGIIQRPSYYNPYRYPDRAKERRDIVLQLMRQNGYLTDAQYRQAVATPIRVKPEQSEFSQSQYFVDLMNEEAQARLGEQEKQTRFLYSTLDPDLQDAAQQAVAAGMESVDKLLRCGRRRRPRRGAKAAKPSACGSTPPQVALIALDPHTGEIKALIGGRNYAASQLNHVLSMRQPGSVFKPFVYAAALETAVTGGPRIFTPATVVDDSPTTFYFDRQTYQPSNFHQNFMGTVTLRTALAHSLNVATVQLAQKVGYDRVVQMAHRVGLNEAIKADAGGRAGRLRDDAARDCGRVHGLRERGRARHADDHLAGARARRHDPLPARTRPAQYARSAGELPDGQHDAGRAAVRDRRRRAWPRLQPAGGGQNRHVARRLVRRIHQQSAVRGLGGFRRQSRAEPGRREIGAADLGGLHEAGDEVPPVPGRAQLPAASGRDLRADLRGFRTIGRPSTARMSRSDMFIDGTQPAIECQMHSLDSDAIRRSRGRCPPARTAASARPRRPAIAPASCHAQRAAQYTFGAERAFFCQTSHAQVVSAGKKRVRDVEVKSRSSG